MYGNRDVSTSSPKGNIIIYRKKANSSTKGTSIEVDVFNGWLVFIFHVVVYGKDIKFTSHLMKHISRRDVARR